MKCRLLICVLISIPLFTSGCGSVAKKEKQIDSVVELQSEVLRKIVTLRSQTHIKDRINADPILVEQETVLLSGLESVINSQEAFLQRNKKTEKK